MPETVPDVEVTNSGQPIVVVITPAVERERAGQTVVTPVANQTVTITPAVE